VQQRLPREGRGVGGGLGFGAQPWMGWRARRGGSPGCGAARWSESQVLCSLARLPLHYVLCTMQCKKKTWKNGGADRRWTGWDGIG
jgi:hypothetical protein